jgi:hypothetical protein
MLTIGVELKQDIDREPRLQPPCGEGLQARRGLNGVDPHGTDEVINANRAGFVLDEYDHGLADECSASTPKTML